MSLFDAVCRGCKRPADVTMTFHIRGCSALGEQLVERYGDKGEHSVCLDCLAKSGEFFQQLEDEGAGDPT